MINSQVRETDILYFIDSDCWASDPHNRPSFEDILQRLDDIVHSPFSDTPHESFHTMQDCWRKEIEEVLHGLCSKEKVFIKPFIQS